MHFVRRPHTLLQNDAVIYKEYGIDGFGPLYLAQRFIKLSRNLPSFLTQKSKCLQKEAKIQWN